MKPVAKIQADEGHDKWFTDQVDLALKEADDLGAVWVEHDDVRQDWEHRRVALLERIAKQSKTA